VPHIYAPTDAEVTFGLAWAQAEDDFETLQHLYLVTRSMLGEVEGKEGAILDFMAFLVGVTEIVDTGFDGAFSPQYVKVLSAYAAGLNAYAEAHPNERLRKDLFPITPKDIVSAAMFTNVFLTSVYVDIQKIFKGYIPVYEGNLPQGSNAFAFSPSVTTDGKTHLVSNTHQPLEGIFSWYEAHLESEEGISILGGTFHGMPSILLGANNQLGWTHTNNHPDLCDVYKLEMHPEDELKYKFDGEWLSLQERKKTIKVKVAFLRLPVSRTFYWSVYGPTIKTDAGVYSLRFPANMAIQAPEQTYWLNRAKDFNAFKEAIKLQYYPGNNVVYADKEGNIFFLSNGHFANRNPSYDWTQVLPGDTSATLWKSDFYPLEALPQKLNPSSGYLYNTNATPFKCAGAEEELDPKSFNPTFGYLKWDNNRSMRAEKLLASYDSFSYKDIKAIKYDNAWEEDMYTYFAEDLNTLLKLDPAKYPEIAPGLAVMRDWDFRAGIANEEASMVTLCFYYMMDIIKEKAIMYEVNQFKEEDYIASVAFAMDHLKKHFGSLRVPLGKVHRHVRGDKNIPMPGMPEVLQMNIGTPYKKGQYKCSHGESYISFMRFSESGVQLETVVPYGSSNDPESPHYTDQMEIFARQSLKPMTLDKERIMDNAERIYHPY
jgi:acyl-homoserine-lactone acylase